MADLEAYFRANPGVNLTAKEIREGVAPEKREAARRNVPTNLAAAAIKGTIVRVMPGVYRLAGS